jgi:hypothetical protein
VFVPSLAEHVTVVEPTAKVDPDPGEQVGVIDPLTRSLADAGPYVTTAPAWLLVVAVTFAGGVTVGGVVSTTVTVNEPAAAPPASTQLTAVAPSGNVEPEPGEQVKPALS